MTEEQRYELAPHSCSFFSSGQDRFCSGCLGIKVPVAAHRPETAAVYGPKADCENCRGSGKWFDICWDTERECPCVTGGAMKLQRRPTASTTDEDGFAGTIEKIIDAVEKTRPIGEGIDVYDFRTRVGSALRAFDDHQRQRRESGPPEDKRLELQRALIREQDAEIAALRKVAEAARAVIEQRFAGQLMGGQPVGLAALQALCELDFALDELDAAPCAGSAAEGSDEGRAGVPGADAGTAKDDEARHEAEGSSRGEGRSGGSAEEAPVPRMGSVSAPSSGAGDRNGPLVEAVKAFWKVVNMPGVPVPAYQAMAAIVSAAKAEAAEEADRFWVRQLDALRESHKIRLEIERASYEAREALGRDPAKARST